MDPNTQWNMHDRISDENNTLEIYLIISSFRLAKIFEAQYISSKLNEINDICIEKNNVIAK